MRNSQEVEDFNLFTSPLSHPALQKGDSMIDLEELKRLHKEAVADEALADEVFLAAMVDQFPAIVAKLEAAQRLRDACRGVRFCAGFDEVNEALAEFEKEQSNVDWPDIGTVGGGTDPFAKAIVAAKEQS